MKSWMLGWCTLVLMLSTVTTAGAGVVLGSSPGATGATRVLAWVQGPGLGLADARTGAPVEIPDLAERAASAGGRLLWVVESDTVDELGMRHVILRQRFRPAPGSVVLPGGLAEEGVPLHGAVVGLHYDPEGSIKVVGAAMFEDVSTVGTLALSTADQAYAVAAQVVSQRDGRPVAPLSQLPPQVVAASRHGARLELFSRGNRDGFDFVWTVPMSMTDGGVVTARVHGASGELLAAWADVAPYFCPDGPGTAFQVVGRPFEEMRQAFFRALHHYWMHMDDWGDVADMVKVAAHDLFMVQYDPNAWPPQQCDDAFDQQIAVAGAFRSVGYEGSGGWVCACESPCAPPVPW